MKQIDAKLTAIQTEISQKEVEKSIFTSIYNLALNLADVKSYISGLLNNLEKNPSVIIENYSYQSDYNKYKDKKNIIDDSSIQINKLLDKYKNDESSTQLFKLNRYKGELEFYKKELNDSGLSILVTKGAVAEFMSENGLMKDANKNLVAMKKLCFIFDKNLQKYNADPNKFGANYNFSGDTGTFRVIDPYHELSRVYFVSSQYLYEKFINRFVQKCVDFEKIENVDPEEKKLILKMKDDLLTQKIQLDKKLEPYIQRVKELKKNPPTSFLRILIT